MPCLNPNQLVPLSDAITKYLSDPKISERLTSTTIKNRKYQLGKFATFVKDTGANLVTEITSEHVRGFLDTQGISEASKRTVHYIIRSFFDYLVQQGSVLDNPARDVGMKRAEKVRLDVLTIEEITAMFEGEARFGPPLMVDRNLLLFTLITDLCLKASDLIRLTLDDVDLESGELRVVRKRGKSAILPLSDYARELFLNWYAARALYKGHELPWVFLSKQGKPLGSIQIYEVVDKALSRVGVEKGHNGPELLRQSGAVLKIQQGEDIGVIQDLLDHASRRTTVRLIRGALEKQTQRY